MKIRNFLAWIVGALVGVKCFFTFYGHGGTITIDTTESFVLVLAAFAIAGASLAKVASDLIIKPKKAQYRRVIFQYVVESPE